MFDEKTITELKYYVYILVNPINSTPFYVGKGFGNRVFSHIQDAQDGKKGTEKLDEIQAILSLNKNIEHVIVRHGLTEKVAFEVEASLIDTFRYVPLFNAFAKGNIQGGNNSIEKGLMSANEIIRKYNAQPLDAIPSGFVIININSSYKRTKGENRIYNATKEIWRMADPRGTNLKFVLSEYKGLIVEVFEVEKWYAVKRKYNKNTQKSGKTYFGYGFDGKVANTETRNLYINKSIAHKKKRGASNPITYNLN